MAKEILCGNGFSRWFDKSLVLEVWQDTAMGGGNMEHSGTDATVSLSDLLVSMEAS